MIDTKLNKKGFTLIELLAVIVVLAIILVITVPMVLNTLGSTRQDGLQASANSVSTFIHEQLGLAAIGKNEILNEKIFFDSKGKVCASGSMSKNDCKTTGVALKIADINWFSDEDREIIGLNSTDYDLANSTITWSNKGIVKVYLLPREGGKFAGAQPVNSQ